MEKAQQWFKAITDLDITTIDSMLNAGEISPCIKNEKGKNGVDLLIEITRDAYEHSRLEEEEKALNILAALFAHGENPHELHHECGEIGNLGHRICLHIIEDAIHSGNANSIERLFQSGQLWCKDEQDKYKQQFVEFVRTKDHTSANAMLKEDLVGIRPEQ